MGTRNPRFHDFWRQRAEPDPLAPGWLGGFDELLSDPALGNEVQYGKKQERLVWCTMVGDLLIPVSAHVRPQLPEHLEVFLKHCPRPHSVFFRQLEFL